MKKTTVGIIIAFVLFLIVFLLYLFIAQRKNNTLIPNQTVTEAPTIGVVYPPKNKLKVIQTTPQNNTNNVGIDSKISISFNGTISDQSVTFLIGPPIKFDQQIQNNNLIVTFSQPLSPGTLYTFTIKYPHTDGYPETFSFRTTGPTQQFLPNTYPGPMNE